jgi:hypothetical protein
MYFHHYNDFLLNNLLKSLDLIIKNNPQIIQLKSFHFIDLHIQLLKLLVITKMDQNLKQISNTASAKCLLAAVFLYLQIIQQIKQSEKGYKRKIRVTNNLILSFIKLKIILWPPPRWF